MVNGRHRFRAAKKSNMYEVNTKCVTMSVSLASDFTDFQAKAYLHNNALRSHSLYTLLCRVMLQISLTKLF